jgi:hypothetical protein
MIKIMNYSFKKVADVFIPVNNTAVEEQNRIMREAAAEHARNFKPTLDLIDRRDIDVVNYIINSRNAGVTGFDPLPILIPTEANLVGREPFINTMALAKTQLDHMGWGKLKKGVSQDQVTTFDASPRALTVKASTYKEYDIEDIPGYPEYINDCAYHMSIHDITHIDIFLLYCQASELACAVPLTGKLFLSMGVVHSLNYSYCILKSKNCVTFMEGLKVKITSNNQWSFKNFMNGKFYVENQFLICAVSLVAAGTLGVVAGSAVGYQMGEDIRRNHLLVNDSLVEKIKDLKVVNATQLASLASFHPDQRNLGNIVGTEYARFARNTVTDIDILGQFAGEAVCSPFRSFTKGFLKSWVSLFYESALDAQKSKVAKEAAEAIMQTKFDKDAVITNHTNNFFKDWISRP